MESVRGRRRVALACQGGGSHTAFTAGVLSEVLSGEDIEVVGLSGTSGGAVCALLAHYGLLTGGHGEAGRLLRSFWEANAAKGGPESFVNYALVQAQRVEASVGITPSFDPYRAPEAARDELSRLLERHVDFERLAGMAGAGPRLFVGAVEVLSGEERAFDSFAGEISVEAVLASCAVPSLFRAVKVGDGLYWDGLFSQNPPLRGLPDTGCDEIWVVQIDPKSRDEEPTSAAQIFDRRNQLAANLSLEQEVHAIETMNRLVEGGNLTGGYRNIPVRRITLGRSLDSASKLDRDPRFLSGLFDEGERTAREFLGGLEPHRPLSDRRAAARGFVPERFRGFWNVIRDSLAGSGFGIFGRGADRMPGKGKQDS